MAFQYTDQANALLTQYEKYDRQKHKLLYDAAFVYYYYLKDVSKAERYLTAYLKTRPKNSKDKVQEYYEKLCKKFPEITFNTGSSLMSGNENKVVINLSSECLKPA
mgnify:FL=1